MMSKRRFRLSSMSGTLPSFALQTFNVSKRCVRLSRMSVTRSPNAALDPSKQRPLHLGQVQFALFSRRNTGRRYSHSFACQRASLLGKPAVSALQSPRRLRGWTTVIETWHCSSLSIAFARKDSTKTVSYFRSASLGMTSPSQTRTLSSENAKEMRWLTLS